MFFLIFRCFFRQLLLRAEYSSPRLLEIRSAVTSDSLRQACSGLRTCLTTQQSRGIQVRSCFPRLLETINNTSLKKHPNCSNPFCLENSIRKNEFAVTGPSQAWTGTDQSGVEISGKTCTDWTLATGTGKFGSTFSRESRWTLSTNNFLCSSALGIYCFQD